MTMTFAPLVKPATAPASATQLATLLAVAEQLRLDGDYQSARDHAEQAAAMAVTLGDRPSQADALRLVALLAARAHDDESAVRIGRRALELLRELGARHGEVETLTTLALACVNLSMYQDALAYSGAAIEGQLVLGALDEAAAAVAQGREIARRDGVTSLVFQLELGQADVLLHRGDPAAAMAHIEQFEREHPQLVDATERRLFELLHKACKQLGRFEEALDAHECRLRPAGAS